jgi:16S rRNA (cytidine1402-2'-O)-methyltransferase
MGKIGCLYLVATPIGDPDDITIRAVKTLRESDMVICEDSRLASQLLKRHGIEKKELIILNEHNQDNQLSEIISYLADGKHLALITDCGTPVFADPGHTLIRKASRQNIMIKPVPGPSSLTAALSMLDFQPERFYFAGFPPRNTSERRFFLQDLTPIKDAVILMDTPYRLSSLLDEVSRIFGPARIMTLACDLTTENEQVFRGNAGKAAELFKGKKGEFILIIHPVE